MRGQGGERTARSVLVVRSLRSSLLDARRRAGRSRPVLLLLLLLLTLALAAASDPQPRWFPVAMLVVPVLAGGFLLRFRLLLLLYAAVVAAVISELVIRPAAFSPGGAVTVAIVANVVAVMARYRERLGVQGTRGESMLVDLRDRLRAQGELPPLPPGWQAEVVLRSAGGASFSGDFVVAATSRHGRAVEVVLVDVSGKGLEAGTRALLLSGAFGGLLGALYGKEFLPGANAYLLRQQWDEGFATAAHLVLDLQTGDFELTSAGHPPGAQFHANSGRWQITHAEGPLLGVLPDAEYLQMPGRLGRGDALLLYTDGLVETPGRDLDEGIDRLLGEAERLVTRGFRHGARQLVDAVAHAPNDDRALVLIWRT